MSARTNGFLNPYLGGAVLGVVLFLSYALTGGGIGASGAVNRCQIAAVKAVLPEHVDRVKYLADTGGGSRNPLANASVWMLLGTFLGGLLSGAAQGRLKVELFKGPRISSRNRLILAFVGGAIMGYGARLARGCTSGQALSGGAVLSVGSFAFMFSIFGAGYALAYFLRRQWI
jgi:hypothetical protein